jgi:hypothetical protein
MTESQDIADEIRQLLRRINDAWIKGNPDELNSFFHERMVIKGPELQTVGNGREACVQGYKDFLKIAVVKDYHESEPAIDVWGNTAVATLPWTMTYELDGQQYTESGHDTFVFTHENRRWLAVWRILLSKPAT